MGNLTSECSHRIGSAIARMKGWIVGRTILSLLLSLPLLFPGPAAAQSPPIIDLHLHFAEAWDIDAFVKQMDALGVAKAGNAAALGSPDALALEWARKYPDQFIPFAGKEAIWDFIRSDGERAWTLQAPAVVTYLQQLEAALKAGQFKGIGEINIFPGPRFPADSPLMRRLWSLSAAFRVPLSIHMDARDEPVAEMERLLASDRRGTLIWAHGGGAGPALVRRLMRAYPNLYADLSGRLPALTRIREWKVLLEELPDRFVIGSDVTTLAEFVDTIRSWRKILDELPPATARKLAYENAERLLNPGR